jgi:pheromone a factor receptor
MSSNRNLNRSRYFRLMALASINILGITPLAIYWLVYNATNGVKPWVSWADTHSFYSRIPQIAAFQWKSNHAVVVGLEGYRWSLVACAVEFFAFFGFADEARHYYRLVYTSFATRIGISTTSVTLHGSSHAYVLVFYTLPFLVPVVLRLSPLLFSTSSFAHTKNKGGVTVSVATAEKRDSTVSISQLSIPSISMASEYKPDFKITEFSPSDSMASSSVDSLETESRNQSRQPEGSTLPDIPKHPYASDVADTV